MNTFSKDLLKMKWLCCISFYIMVNLVASIDNIDSSICQGDLDEENLPWTPYHYSLYIDLNPQLKTFRGRVNITGTLTPDNNKIVLHSRQLDIKRLFINMQEFNRSYWTDEMEGFLEVSLPDDLVRLDGPLNLSIEYEGVINDDKGIIMQEYDKTNSSRWIIFTHLQPIAARTVFPCVDLPKYKATFDINIKNPGLTVLSNMPPKINSNNEVIEFLRTPVMSTYLVAFVVCDYEPLVSNNETLNRITTWVPHEYTNNTDVRRIIEMTPRLLEALENFLESNFSLPKLDQYFSHGLENVGGMENWGLIMYEASSLVFDREDPSFLPFVTVSHELAHNWIGNSVTVSNWCIVWLQEALTTYLSGVILSQVEKTSGLFDSRPILVDFRTDPIDRMIWYVRANIMSTECFFMDSSDTLKPLDDNDKLFTLTGYHKGAAVIRMIEEVVTLPVFKKSLQNFIKAYNNSIITGNELWDILEEQVGNVLPKNLSLAKIVETWETQRGHPVIHVFRRDGSIWIRQEVCIQRYIMNGEWWVPLTYIIINRPETNFNDTFVKEWIPPPSDNEPFRGLRVTLKDNEWMLFNIKGTGFYRVQYDPLSWKLIIEQLERNHQVIPSINRAILIDDSFHTAKNGDDLIVHFEILEYAALDMDSIVWEAIGMNVKTYYGGLPEEEKKYFELFMHSILMRRIFPIVTDTTTWNRTADEDIEDSLLRKHVFELACLVQLPECLKLSIDVVSKVITGEVDAEWIPHGIRKTLWCTAVNHGPQQVYSYVKEMYGIEKDDIRKEKLLELLHCSQDSVIDNLHTILQGKWDSYSLMRKLKNYILYKWQDKCEDILTFLESNKDLLFEIESELVDELKVYMSDTPALCRYKAVDIFGPIDFTEEEENWQWETIFGPKPLEWLQNKYCSARGYFCYRSPVRLPSDIYKWILNGLQNLRSYVTYNFVWD